MSKHFILFYRFKGNEHRHDFLAETLVEAKLKAQDLVDEWNCFAGVGRVLEWVEEVK